MSKPRIRAGLLGLGLIVLTALPAGAQNWPSDSGPRGDYLGSSLRQFDRLSPPSIESTGRGERPVPDMPVTDLPGTHSTASQPPAPRRPAQATARRATNRSTARRSRMPAEARSQQGRETELARELAERDRRIQDLEAQIQQDRARISDPPRGSGSYRNHNPVGTPTATPR